MHRPLLDTGMLRIKDNVVKLLLGVLSLITHK